CGQCYMCLNGRPDRCQMLPNAGNPFLPVAEMADGTKVVQHNNEGGFAELMIPYEWYCMPIFNSVSAVELSVLACVGACGLGTTFGIAPVEPASDVCILGCGPVGLSAVQGARIKGASQIIAVEPIRARREWLSRSARPSPWIPTSKARTWWPRGRISAKDPPTRKSPAAGFG